jgi:hypothetical protein
MMQGKKEGLKIQAQVPGSNDGTDFSQEFVTDVGN